ncbi:MAG: alpha/beta hydrolase [Melioribacteraceae bacterium]|nr:alpha/beta hydrolase [Melioribacteraceae bacterium]
MGNSNFSSNFVEVDNLKLHYIQEGEGEVVLLVHGITTYSFIWRKIIPNLSSKYKVIAIDLIGCGDSDKSLNVSYSLKSHSEFIYKFISTLGINKFHFVGHDLGGGIGQIFAVNHQENLYDLTVINTVAYDFWPVQPIIAMRTPIIRQLAMATLDLGTFRLIVKRGLYHKEKCTDELMNLFWKPMKTSEGRKAFLHFAHCLDNRNLTDISDKLHQLKIPVKIIRGDADLYLSREIAIQLNKNIQGSQLKLIETAGHFIQEDEPELLSKEILEFIEKK